MEILLCWLKSNLLELLVAGGTLGAMYFAYRSAKMSEAANKAQFSPFVIPEYFQFSPKGNGGYQIINGEKVPIPSSFQFSIENRSEYKNAFAKNITISIGGQRLQPEKWNFQEVELKTMDPGPDSGRHFNTHNVNLEDFVPGIIKISYEDILGNKFETLCNLSKDIKYENRIEYNWEYIQK